MDLWLKVLLNLLVSLTCSLVAQIGYRIVALQFLFGVVKRVLFESSAVVVFVKYSDPAWHKVKYLHLLDLLSLLQPLR